MTLPSSGPLSLADIQGEFGGSNPIGLNEYYAGGAYVPAGTTGTYGPVPSIGTISIRDFYGTTAVVISVSSQTISYTSGGLTNAFVGYQLTSAGQVNGRQQSSYYNIEQWCTPTSQASNYEVLATFVSGSTTPTGSAFGSWLPLSATQEWDIGAGIGNYETAEFTIEIRRVGTGTVLASATIILEADAIP